MRFNELMVDLMEQMAELWKHEPFKAKAYKKAADTIATFPDNIHEASQMKGQPGIGPSILEKLEEIVLTGTLQAVEQEKHRPLQLLTQVYGIGPKKAKELVSLGIRSISDLRLLVAHNPNVLTAAQECGLRHYEDVLERIPRHEIDEYKRWFQENQIPGLTFDIVGSYRRGASSSGDIDVILTSQDPSLFERFIHQLVSKDVITDLLSFGSSKCLVMAHLPPPAHSKTRRVDFLYAPPEEYPFAVLYFTGSKYFNTVMRQRALDLGFTMNEHGLYQVVHGKKGDKVDFVFASEQDIFAFLHCEYMAPEQRLDGSAVVCLKAELEAKNKKMRKIEKKEEKEEVKEQVKEQVKEEEEEQVKEEEEEAIQLFLKAFRAKGESFLNTQTEPNLVRMLTCFNELYRNQIPLLTDAEYDLLEEYVNTKFPQHARKGTVGAPVLKNKVKLPYEMASMDKIKPDTGALASWRTLYRGPYVVSSKLDGVSGLCSTVGKIPALYTRGDGTYGQDISYLLPYLDLLLPVGLVIRGEFVIPKKVFQSQYQSDFANARNLVSGIVNRVTVDAHQIKSVEFVAYEVIQPTGLKPSEQMALLSQIPGLRVVHHQTVPVVSNEQLSQWLVQERQDYAYDIDGLIVCQDSVFPRKSGNPEHAFAFKMVLSDQVAEATVVDVVWTASKDGYLKPRVKLGPVHLGGVCIEYATGFNGAFIQDHKIGVGAIVELIRSGDVIPYIRHVKVGASVAKMPEVPYVWNDTHVDVLLPDAASDPVVREKNIAGFFKGIGVDGLSEGNVARMVEAGYDSVPKILRMKQTDFLNVDGFKDRMAEKLWQGIQDKVAAATLPQLMAASNMMGRGFSLKRIELIMEQEPNIFTMQGNKAIKKLEAIKGMAQKTAELFVDHMDGFLAFLQECGLESKLINNTEVSVSVLCNHPLHGKKLVLTGFRDDALTQRLKHVGASLSSSVSKHTFVVLVKDEASMVSGSSGKLDQAKALGIPIRTLQEFVTAYGI